ncbi:MAG: phosphopantetheine-binding protein [Actinomycetaceae bacterium]|nr:phosphopantetheine-binding protein [Actinomycetaceae bacterium]
MGISIAEMLGLELPEEQPGDADAAGQDTDGQDPAGRAEAGSPSSSESENPATGAGDGVEKDDPVQEAVVVALLAESNVPAEDFRSDLTLEGDFDLDAIGRYAVVASIEQDLRVTLKDSEVEDAATLADLIALVRQSQRG